MQLVTTLVLSSGSIEDPQMLTNRSTLFFAGSHLREH